MSIYMTRYNLPVDYTVYIYNHFSQVNNERAIKQVIHMAKLSKSNNQQ